MHVTQFTSPKGNTLGDQVCPFSIASPLHWQPPCGLKIIFKFDIFFWNYINFLSTYIPIFIPVVKFLRQFVLLAWFAKPEKYAYFFKNSISRKFSFFSVCDIYLFICYHLWIWSSCRLTNLKRILKCFIDLITYNL